MTIRWMPFAVIVLIAVTLVRTEDMGEIGNEELTLEKGDAPFFVLRNVRDSPTKSPMVYFGACMKRPPVPRNTRLECGKSGKCRVTCRPHFAFPNGATRLFMACLGGKWRETDSLAERIPACEYARPTCDPTCKNNGTCVSRNNCMCLDGFSGPQCQMKQCVGLQPTPANSFRACGTQGCTVVCNIGYAFPDRSTVARIVCQDGRWVPARQGWSLIPDCQLKARSTCDPPCKNNGTCVFGKICKCLDGYSGTQCQETLCESIPPSPANSRRSCGTQGCTVACNSGYEFPDRSTVAGIICKNGKWVPSRMGWSSMPDCKLSCSPACENNGKCEHHKCWCPVGYSGPQCQYVSHCTSFPPTPANANQSCVPQRCTFVCKSGYKFPDGTTITHVDCRNGKWVPNRSNWNSIPNCRG